MSTALNLHKRPKLGHFQTSLLLGLVFSEVWEYCHVIRDILCMLTEWYSDDFTFSRLVLPDFIQVSTKTEHSTASCYRLIQTPYQYPNKPVKTGPKHNCLHSGPNLSIEKMSKSNYMHNNFEKKRYKDTGNWKIMVPDHQNLAYNIYNEELG